jgi:hypothetical protein
MAQFGYGFVSDDGEMKSQTHELRYLQSAMNPIAKMVEQAIDLTREILLVNHLGVAISSGRASHHSTNWKQLVMVILIVSANQILFASSRHLI